jgi:hypothetical protein
MYRPSIGWTACIVVREPGNRPNRRAIVGGAANHHHEELDSLASL